MVAKNFKNIDYMYVYMMVRLRDDSSELVIHKD